MKKCFSLFIAAAFCVAFLANRSMAENFYVSSATQLQDALTDAETNGENDTLMIAQETYYGNFHYSSSEGCFITLLGGYTSGFGKRIIDPSNTILNGGDSDVALYLYNSNGGAVIIEGLTVKNGNPAISSGGSGIYATSYSTTGPSDIVIVSHCVATENRNASLGGGVYARSYSESHTAGVVQVINSAVTGNESANSGGIYAVSSTASGTAGTVVVMNNTVIGNTAISGGGGGIYAYSLSASGAAGDIMVVNNIVAKNNCENTGGGIFAASSSPSGTTGDVSLTNNTVSENSADFAGGGVSVIEDGNITQMYNNIIWNNSAPAGGDIHITGSGISYGYFNDYSKMDGTWDFSAMNINEIPRFIGNGNYHLLSISPCIDRGSNTAPKIYIIDIDGDQRILDGNANGVATADMGADEFVPVLPVFDGHDFDGNGSSDVSVFRPSNGRWYIKDAGSYVWGQAGDIPVPGDYDGDGTTDIAVWRPSNGRWYVKDIGGYFWGMSGDMPLVR
jgi:hypothetical protein